MKRLFSLVLILLFSVCIGFFLAKDPGYIFIHYGSWSIQMSLWVGALCFIIAFYLLYILLRVLKNTRLLKKRLSIWRRIKHAQKIQKHSQQAWCAYLKGQHDLAKRAFSAMAKYSTYPFIPYIMLARLNESNKIQSRFLEKAAQSKAPDNTVNNITAANILLAQNDYRAVIKLLETHHQKNNTPATLLLRLKAHEALAEYEQAIALLPCIKKLQALTGKTLAEKEIQLYQDYFTGITSLKCLRKCWGKLSHSLKSSASLLSCYLAQCATLGDLSQHDALLSTYLKQKKDAALLAQYAQKTTTPSAKKIAQAEKWLTQLPKNSDLLLCLATLCYQEKLWGKAKDYLQQSINLSPSKEKTILLAQIFDALGEKDNALKTFREL